MDSLPRDGWHTAMTVTHDEASSNAAPPSADETASLPEGGRYVIGAELGVGGGGRVVAAGDHALGRTVALKTLRPGAGDTDGSMRRFREEVRITAGLEHPNIIPVYDVGNTRDGTPYYTMRLVQRHSLRDVLKVPVPREGWSLARLCTVFVQVCHAVGYAHAQGVLHRDLKPDNILLGEFGEVYVADWGIAKLVAERAHVPVASSGDAAVGQTTIGDAMGTVGYMAPEQARGDWMEVDRRADLFSLGVILYEILCGVHPFRPAGATREQIARAVAESEPGAPRHVNPAAPLVLEQLCLALLAKHKEARPDTAEIVAAEIEDFLEGAKEKERRRAEAEGMIERAREPLQRYEAMGAERRRLLDEALARKDGMRAWAPLERKRAVWELEDRAAEVESGQAQALAAALELHQQALAYDPESKVAHAALADLYWSLARRAEGDRREATRIFYESMVVEHDDGRYAALLSADARVSLRSNPPGAAVVAYRYVEVDRVLRAVESVTIGVTPIREARFAAGSYVLVLRYPGMRDVRYPVRCRRGEHHDGVINLYTDDEIGDGFVYVPGGTAVIGGDAEAKGQPLARAEVQVADFAIARFPVTFGEYLRFLNELEATDPEACRWRLPVGKDGRMPVRRGASGWWEIDYEDLIEGTGREFAPASEAARIAMMPLSWYDARAYAAWRSARGPAVRLPTEAEFEKAARGVDERIFPWGNRFDGSFAKMRESRPGFPQAELTGAFPCDESPYGVRDLGGGMSCWAADLHDELSAEAAAAQVEPPPGSPLELGGERFIRGGHWTASPEECRSSSRVRYFGAFRPSECGMRLARTLRPRR